MPESHKAYLPSELMLQRRVGEISSDRSTIVGHEHMMFIYLGSNGYYRQYVDRDSSESGVRWAELTSQRHRRLSSVQTLSLFVPNKASCMPDLYPLPLDIVPTRNWRDAVTCLSSDGGVMFSSNLLAASSRDLRAVASPWRNCDSHWSEFGCLLTANELLRRLGLNDIQSESEEVSPTPLFGDFSQKFGGPALYEMVSRRVKHELPAPIKIFDSGDSRPYTGSVGRRIIWENLAVPIKLHLLIIGNSFSGSGDDSTHLTYWMSRVFMKVTFLHSGQIPTDVLDFYRPDLILFQGLERFMGSVPSDDLKAEVIESVFVGEKQD